MNNRKHKPIISKRIESRSLEISRPAIITSSNGQDFMLEPGDRLHVTSADDGDVTRIYNRSNEKHFVADNDFLLEDLEIRKGDRFCVIERDLDEMRRDLERKQLGFKSKIPEGYNFGRKQSYINGTDYKE